MRHARQVSTFFLPLVLILSSCDESPTSNSEISQPPDILVSWGQYLPDKFLDIPGDILLTQNDQQLYIVRHQPAQTIIVMDRGTGATSTWTPEPNHYPTAIDGSDSGDILCVLYGFERTVSIFSGTHQLMASWTVPTLEGTAGPPYPVDIAYSASTDEVAVSDRSGNRLHLFRLDGTPVTGPVTLETSSAEYSGTLKVAALPSGEILVSLYAPQNGSYYIRRFGSDGTDRGLWGTVYARELAVGGDGNVYLPGPNYTIDRFTAEGTRMGAATQEPHPIYRFAGPLDATVAGGVVVGDYGYPALYEYSPDGQRQQSWFFEDIPDDMIGQLFDITVGPQHTVYTVDLTLRRVTVSTSSGQILRVFGAPGTTDQPLILPVAVQPADDGSVYVIDFALQELRHYSAEGVLDHVRHFGGHDLAAGDDWMYTTDGSSIWRRPLAGGPNVDWQRLGDPSHEYGSLAIDAIKVSGSGSVYALDRRGNRIVKFDSAGQYLGEKQLNPPPQNPGDFDIDHFGRIYVVGGRGEYVIYDENGDLLIRWEDDFARWASAIDIDERGYIYLACPNRDYRILAPVP